MSYLIYLLNNDDEHIKCDVNNNDDNNKKHHECWIIQNQSQKNIHLLNLNLQSLGVVMLN